MKVFYNYFGVAPWLTVLMLGLFLVACGGSSAQQPSMPKPTTGVPLELVAVSVTPGEASVPTAGVQSFVASASYVDGSSRSVTSSATWTSDNASVATVTPKSGSATGIAKGTAVISASFGGMTGSATLTVTSATPVSVVVTPVTAKLQMGITQDLLASALFSDGSIMDVTNTAVWSSQAPMVAAVVTGTGVVTGISKGSAVVSAAFAGHTGVANIEVPAARLVAIAVSAPASSARVGDTRQLLALGTYSDGSHVELGTAANWSSITPQVASVAPTTGLTTALQPGSAVITATSAGKIAAATLVVSAPSTPARQTP